MVLPFVCQNRVGLKEKGPQKPVLWAILGGIFFGLDLLFWTTGILVGGATVATLLANTAPLWVGLAALILFRERLTYIFWAGLILGLFGTVIVITNGVFNNFTIDTGGGYGLISGFFYGAYYIAAQKARNSMRTLPFFWISTTTSALFLLTVSLARGYSLIAYDLSTFIVFILLGIGVQVLGWMSINYAQGFIPASIVSPTLLGQPLLTAIWALILFDERLSIAQLFGGVLVMAGLLLVHLSRR